MATNQSLKGELAKRTAQTPDKKKEGKTVSDLLNDLTPEIQRALPKHMNADRISRIAMTVLRTNEKLRKCNPMSFMGALMQSAQLGLEPNTGLGQAYLIPYGNEVQFQVSYKGLIELAHRSGEYTAIYAHEVYENDEFSYSYGLEKNLKHVPADIPEGDPIGYYAVYKLSNGGYDFTYWSRAKIDKHALEFSKAVQKGWTSPWKTNYDAMAKKTVLKDVLKFAPKSIELQKAVSADSTIKTEVSDDMSMIIDVTPHDEPQQIEEPKQATDEQDPFEQ